MAESTELRLITISSCVTSKPSKDGPAALIFPDDQRFLNPPSMLEAIATRLERNKSNNAG